MRKLCLFLSCLVMCFSAFAVYGQDACNAQSDLLIGHMARVTPGESNNVRDTASADGVIVGKLAGEAQFMVTEGPICAEGYIWWGVESIEQDLVGYTVEGSNGTNWLELVPHQMNYNLDNFTFDFTAVADNVTVSIVPEDLQSWSFHGPSPSHLFVDLENPVLNEQYPPQIRMYPVAYFEHIQPEVYRTIQDYWQRLQTDPDNMDTMFLPQVNAGMIHSSHYARVEFEGGYGIRYIAQFAQDFAPVTGHELFYTFQGISTDGEYYISAVLPITMPSTIRYIADIGSFREENGSIKPEIDETLRTLTIETRDNEFYPTLNALDGVIQSIRLDGSGQMPQMVTSRFDMNKIHFDYSAVAANFGGEIQDWYPVFVADEYPVVVEYRPATIEIMPLYELFSRYLYFQLWDLQQVLREHPDVPSGLATAFFLHPDYSRLDTVEYIQTEQIEGVRFLYKANFDSEPLLYVFEGFSADRDYFIHAQMPIDESPDGITPCLDGLDVIFETMTFDGSIVESDVECEG